MGIGTQWSKYETLIVRIPRGNKNFYTYSLAYPEGFLGSDGKDISHIIFYVGKGKWRKPTLIQRVDMHEKEALLPCFEHAVSVNRRKITVIRRIWAENKSVAKQILSETDDEQEPWRMKLCSSGNMLAHI